MHVCFSVDLRSRVYITFYNNRQIACTPPDRFNQRLVSRVVPELHGYGASFVDSTSLPSLAGNGSINAWSADGPL